jgi:hypothetical protein
MNKNPYVVDSLRPERLGGGGGIYQLDANSVSPTRITGVDELGNQIEETIPAAYHRQFVTLDGCINNVVLRSGVVFSMEPEAERYETMVVRDVIRAGWIPIEACPYSYDYGSIKGGPGARIALVKVPAGEVDCGGKPGAHDEHTCCVHLQKIIADRRAKAQAEHAKRVASQASMKPEQVQQLLEMNAKAFGVALGNHFPDQKAAKQRLREGKGEEG